MKHICAFCSTNGFDNAHTIQACHRKKGSSQQTGQKGIWEDKRDPKSQRPSNTQRSDTNSDFSKN